LWCTFPKAPRQNKTLDAALVGFGYNAELNRFRDAQHHRSPKRLPRSEHLFLFSRLGWIATRHTIPNVKERQNGHQSD
jgi:hypothetical protein